MITFLNEPQIGISFKHGPLFVYFWPFQHQNNFYTMYVKSDPSSRQHLDSIPQPLGHESPPLTTRPGLPP